MNSSPPWRGAGGSPRPAAVAGLLLPPDPMPVVRRTGGFGLRPRHRWRYIGVYDEELMVVVGDVHMLGMRQTFWSLWDRRDNALLGRTSALRHRVSIEGHFARVRDGSVSIDITVAEGAGVENVCASGELYGWTRKQAGIPATVSVTRDGVTRELSTLAAIDDTDGYHARHLHWQWSIGVGRAPDGTAVAWNLVHGINDPEVDSERSVWVEGVPHEVGPVVFAPDLTSIDFAEGGSLLATHGPVRVANGNRLVIRSTYRQPFATFSGSLPGVGAIERGLGVMEEHDIHW